MKRSDGAGPGGLAADLARAILLLAAFLTLAIGLLAWGGVVNAALDGLTHFAPFGLLLAGACGVFAGLFDAGRRPGFLRLAGGAAFAWGLLMVPELMAAVSGWRTEPAGPGVKIIQFNVWGDDLQAERKLAWLRGQGADVIVLEEVSPASGPILDGLRDLYPYQVTCEKRPYPCSVMILARRSAQAEGHFSGKGPWQANTAWARFASPEGPFTVMGVHMVWPTPDGHQQRQQKTLAAQAKAFDARTLIVAGDFNSTPWSFSLRRLDKALGLPRRTRALASWPSGQFTRFHLTAPMPAFPIDHIYAGPAWRTVRIDRGPNLGSDHFPIVVTLTRQGGTIQQQ